jgi:hypothetical protein
MSLQKDFAALCETYTEMLVGDSSQEMIDKIKMWSIYNHIHKTMPAMASHWNKEHPESKLKMKELFEEIRALNEVHREKKKSEES